MILFLCVVVLCSVFFLLGMVAGRTQSAELEATSGAAPAAPADASDTDQPDLTFYESVSDANTPGLEALPPSEPPRATSPSASPLVAAAREPAAPDTPPVAGPGDTPITLQVGALANAAQAQNLSEDLVEKGFPAFVLRPGPGDTAPLNRVRVGPFSNVQEAATVRAALEAEGFEPIVVR